MKAPFWNKFANWQEAEKAWDDGALQAGKENPLRVLKTLPQMPGIAKEDAKFLKWKSLQWMLAKDEGFRVFRKILKKPFTHTFGYIKSLIKGKSYVRDGDFFLYGVASVTEFQRLLDDPKTLFVVGFSYCEKPHECPSGRFTAECIHDPEHPVCRQCFIGKAVNTLPQKRAITLFIPTIHYIAEEILKIIENNPERRVVFLITACEMTLEMFGDFGNMAKISGIGVRLDGRICNTMRAFELSERGIKPGLTVVLSETERRILDLLNHFRTTSERTQISNASMMIAPLPHTE